MIHEAELKHLAQQLGLLLHKKNRMLATAESCTGGMLGQALTAIPGSSCWYECGFIPYSNTAKQDLLGVAPDILQKYGAVSRQTVKAMVQGAIRNSRAQCAIAVSGIAGPGGGSAEKPVGTVLVGWGMDETVAVEAFLFKGSREAVRQQAACKAFAGMIQRIRSCCP